MRGLSAKKNMEVLIAALSVFFISCPPPTGTPVRKTVKPDGILWLLSVSYQSDYNRYDTHNDEGVTQTVTFVWFHYFSFSH